MIMRIIYLYENFVHPSNESVNDDFLVCFYLKFLCHKEANLFTFESLVSLKHRYTHMYKYEVYKG